MEAKRFSSFAEFWPFYVGEHSHPTSRKLHFVGTTGTLIFFVMALVQQEWAWLAAAVFCGYFFAWIGHFLVEKNRPATFKYPFYSLASDFKMYFFMLTRRMDAEIERLQRAQLLHTRPAGPIAPGVTREK